VAFLRAAAALAAAGALVGTATAATIAGGPGGERLRGTARADLIHGGGGNDVLSGGAGNDRLDGGRGRDSFACGRGRDVAVADAGERVGSDCEVVVRRISRDPGRGPSFHETEVEPDSFAFGSKVVAAFQVGRFRDGGASGIGFATSANAGRTWRSGLLRGLTTAAPSPGPYPRASDPAVAYDAKHGVWLVVTLAIDQPLFALAVSRSADGLGWSPPVVAFTAPPAVGDALGIDKEWIVCDNGTTSPFRGRCYVSYTDFQLGLLTTRRSDDGGLTWSGPVSVATGFDDNGPQPLVRPDGELVIPIRSRDDMYVLRSRTGGESFLAPERIAPAPVADTPGLRAPSLPSAEVAGDGTVFVAWHGCSFRASCSRNDVVLARGDPGGGWTVSRIPIHPVSSAFGDFTPGIAVDPGGSGGATRLAVTYYTLRPCGADCRIDAGIVTSRDAGRTWSPPQPLNVLPMQQSWLPPAGGRFLGDYISTSFAGGRAVGVFTLAEPPFAGRLDEAIYATSLAVR
jgi:hypothetical protein